MTKLEEIARAMAKRNWPGATESDINEMWEGWIEEAIQALLMANIMQMDRLNFQLDYTYVLSARMQIQDGSIVYFADATPAAYLALVDEFGLRTMFEILQLERNHDQRH